jgi:3-methyl-2-oxobutanoate hydroxymethyltransferase
MLGLFDGQVPSFVKQYADLAKTVTAAVRAYADDVRTGAYPPARTTVSSTEG